MERERTFWRVLVLVMMAGMFAASAGPAFAKDELPPIKDSKSSGGACSPDYQKWCHDNLTNYAGQPCGDIKFYVRPDGKCQCDCMDKAGGVTPGKKKKGPG
jgi:hypothetical protein